MLITHDLGIIAGFARGRARDVRGRARSSTAPVDDVFAAAGPPVHAGAASPPCRGSATRAPTTLPSIPGVAAAADAIPPGCRFAPRCRLAGDARASAARERPAFDLADPARRVACHFTDESRATAGVHPRAGGRRSASRRSARRCSSSTTSRRTTARAARRGSRKRWLRAVDGVSLRDQERRVARPRRRVGLGQVDRRAPAPRAHRADARRRSSSRGGRSRQRAAAIAREHRGRMQMVFQDPGDSLNPLMTVDADRRRAAAAAPAARGATAPRRASRAARARRARPPTSASGARSQLSGGQRQRVAIARALATDPALDRLRRGGLVARRLGARADPQPPDGPAAAARALLPLHLARPLDRAPRLRPRRRDVRRPVRRGRRRGRDLHARRSTRTRSPCSPPCRSPTRCASASGARIRLEGELPDLTSADAGLHLRLALLEGAGALLRSSGRALVGARRARPTGAPATSRRTSHERSQPTCDEPAPQPTSPGRLVMTRATRSTARSGRRTSASPTARARSRGRR